jgi:hypothetical protein
VKKKYHTRYDPQQVAEVVQAVEALTQPARQTIKETIV